MADGMMTTGAHDQRPVLYARAKITPAELRRQAAAAGLQYPMQVATGWAGMERRRRAAGAERQSWARHAARHICQGIIGEEDALLALVLIEWTMRERDAVRIPNDPAGDLDFARFTLAQAVASEEMKRALLARKMRDQLEPMLGAAPAAAMMQALRRLNDDAGRLFVSPQLRQLLEQEVILHLRRTGRQAKGRQNA